MLYIGFVQESDNTEVVSSFSNLQVLEGTKQNAFENGKCTDLNARNIGGPPEVIDGILVKCICTDGFFSSNGENKKLRNQDACVACIESQGCSLSRSASDVICARDLLVNARLGGLRSAPLPIYARLQSTPLSPLLVSGEGGGTEVGINSKEAITLYGGVSKSYKLDSPYTIDKFSRLYFYLAAAEFDGFLVFCLNGEINPYNSTATLCINFEGDADAENWNTDMYTTIPFNLAIGKPTIQTETKPGYASSYAVDGNLVSEMMNDGNTEYPIAMTEKATDPSWEVDLEGEYLIKEIVIHFTTKRSTDSMSDYFVEIFLGGEVVFYHMGETYLKAEDAPFEVTITLPTNVNIKGNRVKMTLRGNSRILALREVQVYEKAYEDLAATLIDLPIGKIKPGMVVKYFSFVQSASDRETNSNFADFNFVYGNAKGATPAPTVSFAPTESMSPSISLAPSDSTESMSPSVSSVPTATNTSQPVAQ